MPILGISSSGRSASVTVFGDYEAIATVTVGSGSTASSIDFNSIPGTYRHLQVRGIFKANKVDGSQMYTRFNGDTTTSNYRYHYVGGQGSVTFAGTTANEAYFAPAGSANGLALVMDILDYTNTNKYKTVRYLGGVNANGSGQINIGSNPYFDKNSHSDLNYNFTFNQITSQ